ncbi:MAG: glycosyltransferase [Candidatus Omnitrophota bacterium]|nr:glycosyltransferase [Candidatus Omnitrophota bacterium]
MRYGLWVLAWVIRWRPQWVYASDPFSCPIVLLLAAGLGLKVLYHEHDPPDSTEKRRSWFVKGVSAARGALARRAALCLFPNEDRLRRFVKETGRTGETLLVWNCPSKGEAGPPRDPLTKDTLTLFYHGSIVPSRLPRVLLEALRSLPASVELRVAGYSTVGHSDYAKQFQQWAGELGVADRVKFIGVVPIRHDLLEQTRRCDVGVALMPTLSGDFGERTMAGASNKPFDYLACGLALLVSDLPDWKKAYGVPGYGLLCDPADPQSIAEAIRWFLERPDQMRAMGEKGRRRILSDWNYETQFKAVLPFLEGAR